MPTTKKRLNLTVSPDLDAALQLLAERDALPQAAVAMHLLQIGLEIEEDEVWNSIAAARDTKNAKFIPHTDVW